MSRYIDADKAIEIWKDQDYIKLSSQEVKARMMLDAVPSADVIEIGKPYKRDKDHVLCFEITKDDYGEEWWTIRRQEEKK